MENLKQLSLFLCLVFLLFGVVAFGVTTYLVSLPTGGGVKVNALIGAYSDPDCTHQYTSISWGDSLSPAQSVSKMVYVKNLGNVPLTLTISSSDYVPMETSQYMTLSWDYNGTEIMPLQVCPVEFTLLLSAMAYDNMTFSFNLNILGAS
jgi:hypothetical protein